MNVFDYLRVSGISQVEGDGFPRQQEALARFRSRHNMVCLGEFKEEGVSGTTEGKERPKFAEMLLKAEALTDLKIEAIVVENMDRLARDLMVSEFMLMDCRKAGLKVFCADQGELVDMAEAEPDANRTLWRHILGALAQWEKTRLVVKLRSARIRNKIRDGVCEGKKPYGHSQAERDLLKEMHAFKEKGFTYANIAVELNAAGKETRHGKHWTKDTVFSAMTGKRRKK